MRMRGGNGGWHRVEGEDLGLPGRVYFRVQEIDGYLRMTELYVDGRGAPIAAGALRRLPVAMLEQWASRMSAAMERLNVAGPDLSRLAAYYATTFGKAQHWVAQSWRAQYDEYKHTQAPWPREVGRDQVPETPKLEAPENGLTDQFLSDVARAYDAAVAQRLSPAKALAEAAGVPHRTAQRWVYTARKRGLMPPATSRGRIV